METVMKKTALALWLLLACTTMALACKLPDVEPDFQFEPGATRLAAGEVKKFVEWRIRTRERYAAGYDAVLLAYEGDRLGVPHALAVKRVEFMRAMLVDFGVSPSDIGPPEFSATHKGAGRLNVVSILIGPRCPHACCEG